MSSLFGQWGLWGAGAPAQSAKPYYLTDRVLAVVYSAQEGVWAARTCRRRCRRS